MWAVSTYFVLREREREREREMEVRLALKESRCRGIAGFAGWQEWKANLIPRAECERNTLCHRSVQNTPSPLEWLLWTSQRKISMSISGHPQQAEELVVPGPKAAQCNKRPTCRQSIMMAYGCWLGKAGFNGKIPPRSQTSVIRRGIKTQMWKGVDTKIKTTGPSQSYYWWHFPRGNEGGMTPPPPDVEAMRVCCSCHVYATVVLVPF